MFHRYYLVKQAFMYLFSTQFNALCTMPHLCVVIIVAVPCFLCYKTNLKIPSLIECEVHMYTSTYIFMGQEPRLLKIDLQSDILQRKNMQSSLSCMLNLKNYLIKRKLAYLFFNKQRKAAGCTKLKCLF